VIVHLIGDPIETLKDLLHVTSSCEKRAKEWIEFLDSKIVDRQILRGDLSR
jgi:hypothetical protein